MWLLGFSGMGKAIGKLVSEARRDKSKVPLSSDSLDCSGRFCVGA